MGQFDKFKNSQPKGAKKKEQIKQEKRKAKKETADYFEALRKQKQTVLAGKRSAEKGQRGTEKPTAKPIPNQVKAIKAEPVKEPMPLNKYIAHSGVCSRRDAAAMVKEGLVKVNNMQVTDPGFKVSTADNVTVNGKTVKPKQNLVYILLNKPKDFITTAEDDKGRKTVLDIVKNATTERVFPVGRLDRNTTGVLLITNDGDLAQQLTHPSFEVKKIYEVKLDKPLLKADLDKLLEGVTLEDGKVHADAVAYADPKDKSIVGVEIHSGKNRVVRRMFEHLGYDVKALDRVMFANLTKKNVERGKWRFLTEKEIRLLKFFNKSKGQAKGAPKPVANEPTEKIAIKKTAGETEKPKRARKPLNKKNKTD
jgi:23S rRNA pseudouridine2605 synthase